MAKLILILGDQLNKNISSLSQCNKPEDVVLMCEVIDEASYVKHHKKKIAFIFSAMRHFAQELIECGYKVEYIKLNDVKNTGSFKTEIIRALQRHSLSKLVLTMPGEYRVLEQMQTLAKDVDIDILEDDRFYCSIEEFKQWAGDNKQLRMENFYRHLRKKYNVLMNDGKPVGGKWNFDKENRKVPGKSIEIPAALEFKNDEVTSTVLKLIEKKFPDYFGDLEPFTFAVTRKQALKVLNHFIKFRLKKFGDYQDAMLENEPFMYHSLISFYLNIGLLLPKEVIQKAQNAYIGQAAPINAVEGFIRQVLGWREFIRGIYWLKMPDYAKNNFFEAKRKLPSFYWNAQTKMNCMHQCIQQTKQYAYAHHIQRLMVLGNFALLSGIHPDEVNEWYLIVYADAFEWVELPNVTGMILFADGGYLASKPYAAGGAYIKKMSNYCSSCHYKINNKTGSDACPFNYLYWNFLDQHRDKLANNQRLSMMYATLNKFSDEKINAIRDSSKAFLESI